MTFEVGDESSTGADLDTVHPDGRRHLPLRLFPAQHSQLRNERRRQEPGLVRRGRAAAVQPPPAEASDAA